MKMTRLLLSLASAAVFGFAGIAHGQEQAQSVPAPSMEGGVAADYGKCCKDCCCVDPCCCSGGYYFEAEATFFRFHEADGVVRGAPGTFDGEFDFDAAPRLTLGYVNCDGMGARIRYWSHDADATFNNAAGAPLFSLDVDTTNLDFEVFQEICLDCCTTLEVSAGIRVNDFEWQHLDAAGALVRSEQFDGFGGMIAVEVRRDLGNCWGAYARLREIILMDDREIDTDGDGVVDLIAQDVTLPVTEIAFGLDYTSCNWSAHAGVEWQNWGNYLDPGQPAGRRRLRRHRAGRHLQLLNRTCGF